MLAHSVQELSWRSSEQPVDAKERVHAVSHIPFSARRLGRELANIFVSGRLQGLCVAWQVSHSGGEFVGGLPPGCRTVALFVPGAQPCEHFINRGCVEMVAPLKSLPPWSSPTINHHPGLSRCGIHPCLLILILHARSQGCTRTTACMHS